MYMNNLLSACFVQEEGVSVAYVIGFTRTPSDLGY